MNHTKQGEGSDSPGLEGTGAEPRDFQEVKERELGDHLTRKSETRDSNREADSSRLPSSFRLHSRGRWEHKPSRPAEKSLSLMTFHLSLVVPSFIFTGTLFLALLPV